MSIESFFEAAPLRGAMFQLGANEDDRAMLRRHFVFKMTSGTDDYATILSSGRLPQKGTRHPSVREALATNFIFNQKQKCPNLWDAIVEYSLQDDPLERDAMIDWSYVQFQKPIRKAKRKRTRGVGFTPDALPIVNSADVRLNPPPVVDDSRLQVMITKNTRYMPRFVLQYQDAVNSDPVKIDGLNFASGTLKCQGVRVSRERRESFYRYREVVLILHYRAEGWDLDVMDVGFEEYAKKENPNGQPMSYGLRKIYDKDGVLIKEPALLDGKGRQLRKGAAPVFLTYRHYQQLPFAQLPLA